VGVHEALVVLRSRRAEIGVLLGAAALAQLEGNVRALALHPTGSLAHDDLLSAITRAVLALPARHPARQALLAGGSRLAPRAAPMTLSSIQPEVRLRLLAATSITAARLRESGHDPDDPGLIRFSSTDGVVLPAFQFDDRNRPHPVVTAINILLGSDLDPWGVGDWWLGAHSVLGGPPAALITAQSDDLLVAVARDLVAED
jgi:hypothetical protein